MTKYDIIFEELQEKVLSGELTMEDAQVLNNVAFEKYGEDNTEYEEVTESTDEGVTYEEYLEAMEEELFGESFVQQVKDTADKFKDKVKDGVEATKDVAKKPYNFIKKKVEPIKKKFSKVEDDTETE